MMRKLIALLMLAAAPSLFAQGREADVETAKSWWPEQYNVWTPLCWPDHFHKFAAIYNGNVLISPGQATAAKPHAKPFLGEDFQLTFCASADGREWPVPARGLFALTGSYPILREWDGGLGVQGWLPGHEAPVLRTEYRSKDGIVLETNMFAHINGAGDVRTGIEPEYLWIRIAVKHVDDFYHPDGYKMNVILSRLFYGHCDYGKLSPDIWMVPECAICDRPLSLVDFPLGGRRGYKAVEENGKVRLGVFPGGGQAVHWKQVDGVRYNVILDFPAEEGSYVDLVFPAMVDDENDFAAETALSFEAALAEADRYWSSLHPDTEATFDVPETYINEAVRENFRIARTLGEKDYVTGDYSYISGVWQYDAFWPTPGSMVSAMFMDPMGHFADTERYTEVFAKLQGARVAPGSSYSLHPGYFSTPEYLQSVDWLTDHGAVMYQAATHALLSGDADFIARWTEPLVKACDFIMTYSRSEHAGVPGLLPAGWSTDEEVPLQSVWNLAWNYKGLSETVRLLRKTGHPRAAEFEAFQKEFKETFLREYRKVCEEGPRWTDDRGNLRFRPPTELSVEAVSRFQTPGREGWHTVMTDAFYLDGGPLCLVWAGLMDADDPIMEDLLAFFREGPNWKLHKPFPWSLDRAVLEHEISSCEPCYSFNAYHSWQLGDRERFLEAMYSVLVGAVSNNTYISCEHRHGIQGNQFAFPFGFYLARLSVIDDQISRDNLHLLRFCPLAWLKKDRPARFLKMPTEFGPVDLTAQLSADGKTLEVTFAGAWREKPGEIVLHVPPVPGLKKVSVNGKKFTASKGEIRL